MRITGGALAGRKVHVPPGIIRPAMDRMRESVFAVLGDLEGASFLDLFSGSGVVALEAASRGAHPVEAVESDAGKRAVLLANAQLAPQRLRCHFIPVERYVKRARAARFDRIFCDPPFPYKFKAQLLCAIARSGLMDASSLLLIHRPARETFDEAALPLSLCDRRAYGRSVVDFYRLPPA
ncbi:MAG: RsmD family RNA methyltransferase [Spirochaetaceae bacterium]|jgi:16S rRNA (guanine(966)-N(2))-methyltransferase RsmD|nr:RsmD family RNA methyltransferase [Spirochaetaceae bacterium]